MRKPPPLRFSKVKSAEWVQPFMKDYYMACCDCGLVHRMNFRIRNGRVQFQAFRHEAATKVRRGKKDVTVKV